MDLEDLLYLQNPWWEDGWKPAFINREKYASQMLESLSNKNIVFLKGLRRTGKTTLMNALISKLVLETQPEKVFYASLDAIAFNNLSILEVIDEYRKIHGIKAKEKVFLFLDEIAAKQDYEQQLKNLYDFHNVKAFASSSTQSFHAAKKGFLTGRMTEIDVSPLDFLEYLDFRKIRLDEKDARMQEAHFEEYLKDGGMPE
ncbi:ATP-binding protein, partial [Candidatus Micrarchaeota archaeon]|nr:ATP-binding protein [Candidatus Micrarchaeota archaeon]